MRLNLYPWRDLPYAALYRYLRVCSIVIDQLRYLFSVVKTVWSWMNRRFGSYLDGIVRSQYINRFVGRKNFHQVFVNFL